MCTVNLDACQITIASIPPLISSSLKYLVEAVIPLPRGSRRTESVQSRQLIYVLKSFASFPCLLEVLRGLHVPIRAENKGL